MKHPFKLAAALILVGFLAVGGWHWMQPHFPADLPNAEQMKEREGNASASDLALRLTNHLRRSHGHLLQSNQAMPTSEEEAVILEQEYRRFDETRLFDSAREIAKKEELVLKIKKLPQELESPYLYQLDFLKESRILITLLAGLSPDSTPETSITNLIDPTSPPKFVAKGKLAIVIDDLGQNFQRFEEFIEVSENFTFSILPLLPYSEKTAALARERNLEVMLHLPMQPKGWPEINPGEGALMVEEELALTQSKLEEHLTFLPEAKGINNHMGSAFTQFPEGMEEVMRQLSAKKMFFLDSKTAPGDISKEKAEFYGVPFKGRDIFLDNERDVVKIKLQLRKAIQLALKKRRAIAICHPYPETLQAFKEALPELAEAQVAMVRLSEFF